MFRSRGIECEEKDIKNTLTTAEKVSKKNTFSLMMTREKTFVDEKKEPT